MRAVVQRVKNASVSVDGVLINEIGTGLLVFAGFGKNDGEKDLDYMVPKIGGLRIFPGDEKESSRSVADMNGEILLISQFTLYGDVKKGKRPSFSDAM
jgi:D-aminoacyl-tRNA deacylase